MKTAALLNNIDHIGGIKQLVNHIYCLTGKMPGHEEQSLLSSVCHLEVYKRRQLIQLTGKSCKQITFIISGATRMFTVDERGRDLTINLAVENSWIFDPRSLLSQTSSDYSIEATEQCLALQIPVSKLNVLKQQVQGFATVLEMHSLIQFAAVQKRLLAAMSMSADRRYSLFKHHYPTYVNRFPQQNLASYLGMSSETLSRLKSLL